MAEQLLARPDAPHLSIPSGLARDILALENGSHLCLIDDADSEQQPIALLPYFRQGLEAGERCIGVAGPAASERLRESLADLGIDLAREAERGALVFFSPDQWPDPGASDCSTAVAQVRGLLDAALNDGFRGVRFAIDMAPTSKPDTERFRIWEDALDSLFTPDLPARMICRYTRDDPGSPAMLAALHTHPVAVLGEDVCPNPYYARHERFDALPTIAPGTAPVDWMIAQLRWTRAFEKEREQRVRAEGALAASEENQRNIQDLYALAESTAAELRKANAIKDDFVGLVSHELRTPITVILGNATVLLKSMTFDNDAHYGALQDIRSEAERLNRLVSNMLVLAKLDGMRQPELEPMLIGPVVTRIAAEHQRRHGSRRINIQLRDVGTPCLANAVYVEQILANLLSNAEKYSSPEEPVELSLSRDDGWLTLRVEDRGIGLHADDANHLFEAFFRADAASSLSTGIGIGLAACKRLVEAQDGRIWARSREGGGAEFGFSLRVVEAPE